MAWIWITGGSLEKIPRIITLFDRGKEFKVSVVVEEPSEMTWWWPEFRRSSREGKFGIQIQNSKR